MKIIKLLYMVTFVFFTTTHLSSNELSFNEWLKSFKIYALNKNISEESLHTTSTQTN